MRRGVEGSGVGGVDVRIVCCSLEVAMTAMREDSDGVDLRLQALRDHTKETIPQGLKPSFWAEGEAQGVSLGLPHKQRQKR
jgi:hypothetical protein